MEIKRQTLDEIEKAQQRLGVLAGAIRDDDGLVHQHAAELAKVFTNIIFACGYYDSLIDASSSQDSAGE